MRYFGVLLSVLFLACSLSGSSWAKSTPKKKRHHLNTSVVRKIHKRQGKRLPLIDSYKKKGIIGEGDQGLLVVKSTRKLSGKKAKALERTVASENSDREKIFEIIIKANKYTKEEIKVLRESMFESYLSADPHGVYYYKNKNWIKK